MTTRQFDGLTVINTLETPLITTPIIEVKYLSVPDSNGGYPVTFGGVWDDTKNYKTGTLVIGPVQNILSTSFFAIQNVPAGTGDPETHPTFWYRILAGGFNLVVSNNP